MLVKQLENDAATVALGQLLAKQVQQSGNIPPLVIYLQGGLGMGKTTFSRGFIQGLGHSGAVKSPTYALVEPYEMGNMRIFHFDLYRLHDPEELEFMGIRDYFGSDCICIVEWPERGFGLLPPADLEIQLEEYGAGRQACISAHTNAGKTCVTNL